MSWSGHAYCRVRKLYRAWCNFSAPCIDYITGGQGLSAGYG